LGDLLANLMIRRQRFFPLKGKSLRTCRLSKLGTHA
jgi:hypothetical protein